MRTDTFASFVAALRKKRGLTQKGLAEALGFTPQGISRFESLDSGFDLTLIDRLCRVLDISFEELCSRQIEGAHYVEAPWTYDALPQEIKKQREAKKLSQEELAKAAKITSRSLRCYESGGSLPSFQTLERIALALETAPIDLLIPKAEPVIPAEPLPLLPSRPSKARWAMPLASALALASIAIGLPIGLVLGQNSSMQRTDLEAGVSALDSGVGDPYVPPSSFRQEHPNFLAVDAPKNEFNRLGETIEFVLYDPDLDFSLTGMNQSDYAVSASSAHQAESSLDIEFVVLGGGKVQATLKEGLTGDMVWLDATIGEFTFEKVSYFRYRDGNPVVCGDDGVTTFDDGLVSGQDSMNLNRQTTATGQAYLSSQGETVPFVGSLLIADMSGPSASVSYEPFITIGVSGLATFDITVSTEKDVVSDDIYLFVAVFIEEGEWYRPFFLTPWRLHLNK